MESLSEPANELNLPVLAAGENLASPPTAATAVAALVSSTPGVWYTGAGHGAGLFEVAVAASAEGEAGAAAAFFADEERLGSQPRMRLLMLP